MIRSMTGFARRERQGPWGTLTCELRSVNHRYLELSLRLPDDLRGLENDARQLLAGSLRRGKVDAGVYLKGAPAGTTSLEINRAVIEQLVAGTAEVRAVAGDAVGTLNPLDVLRWPGVIRDTERDVTPIATAAVDLLKETAADLNEARAREGARIREMLAQRCEALRDLVAVVRARLPEVSSRIRARVLERVAQLGTTVEARPSTASASSRRSPCSPTRWTSRRNSTVSAATSPRRCRSSTPGSRPDGGSTS